MALPCFAAFILALACCGSPGLAEEKKVVATTPGQTFVVLVGISDYKDKQIKPRPKAEVDTKALYALFTNKDYLGVEEKNAKLLLGNPEGKAEVADRANFLKALKWVAEEAKEGDKVIFSFIGQGGPIGDSGDRRCFFLADSTFKGRDKDAVTAEEIEDALKKLKSKRFCVFLDIDFKGFDGTGVGVSEPTLGKAPYREFLGDDGSEDHLPMPGRVAFLATNGLHTSLDLDKHGLFTEVILEGLQGKADSEGYEPDGLVTVDELSRYMNKRLPELARKHGKTEKEKEQDHFIIAGPQAHFVLTTNPEKIGENKKRLAAFQQLVSDGKIKPASLAGEGELLLRRMPLLKAKQELRKAYQSLADGKIDLEKFTAEREKIQESTKLKRTDAMQYALKVLEATDMMKADYVKDVSQGEMVGWAIKELYSYVEEKVPEQVAAKLKDAKKMRILDLRNLLVDARTELGVREDLDNLKDLTITLQRMLQRLDTHTTYIDPETKKKFDTDIVGHFTGIGIQIRKDAATDQLLVVTPIKGAPAHKAKIQAGDVITKIIREVDSNGKPLSPPEEIETKGLNLNKAVKLILGVPDTKVKLEIKREGVEKPLVIEVTRGRVETESIHGAFRKTNDEWDYMLDPKYKIGYIRLSSFSRTTYRDLENAVADLKKQGMKGLVLDLRFNPGGLLDSAIKVTDLFVDDGLIVSIRPRGGQANEARYPGRHNGSLLDFPMVCLVNGFSASGSEIVSAALQDHNRALVFGERSYGKGSVQNIKPFEVTDSKTGDKLEADIKFTTATFWRPNGQNLNKASTSGKEEEIWGVTPDKVIKLTTKERRDLAEYQRNTETIEPEGKKTGKLKEFKDKQLEASMEYLRGQIKLAMKR
jgi:C-terminal peptidase prc